MAGIKGDYVFLEKNKKKKILYCSKGQVYRLVPFSIIMLLIFILGFYFYKNSVSNAVKKASFTQSEQISSIINLLQSAPETTHFMFRTVQGKCKIEINQMYVAYEAEGEKYKSNILQADMRIKKSNFDCSENMRKNICFVKNRNTINIFEPLNDCLRG